MLEDLIPELFDEVLGLLDLHSLISTPSDPATPVQVQTAFGAKAFSWASVDFSRPNLQLLSHIGSCNLWLAVRGSYVRNWGGRWKHDLEIPDGQDGYWPRLRSGVLDPESELVKQFVDTMSLFSTCTLAMVMASRVRL